MLTRAVRRTQAELSEAAFGPSFLGWRGMSRARFASAVVLPASADQARMSCPLPQGQLRAAGPARLPGSLSRKAVRARRLAHGAVGWSRFHSHRLTAVASARCFREHLHPTR